MFERYTETARRAIFFARYEASANESPYIEAEHILLGLLREDKQLFSTLLGPGTNAFALAEDFRRDLQKGPSISTGVDLPFSPAVKRSLAYAEEEAARVNEKTITPGHLLLGLLRQDSRASGFLEIRGVTLTSAREKITIMQISSNKSAELIADLKTDFAPLVRHLTWEVEPAFSFSLRRPNKEGHT